MHCPELKLTDLKVIKGSFDSMSVVTTASGTFQDYPADGFQVEDPIYLDVYCENVCKVRKVFISKSRLYSLQNQIGTIVINGVSGTVVAGHNGNLLIASIPRTVRFQSHFLKHSKAQLLRSIIRIGHSSISSNLTTLQPISYQSPWANQGF